MEIKNKDIFKFLINELFNLPIWIKHIIYLELKKELETPSIKNYLNFLTKENCLQLYIPKLTYAGKNEIEKRTGKYSQNVYNILEGAFEKFSIVEISIANNWNLVECSKYFLEAVDNELVINPDSPAIKGTALYMAQRIRLGEYFIKINKINMEQLDKALTKQKELEKTMGDRPGLADILVNMGYLTEDDTKGILLLKKDSSEYYQSGFDSKKKLFANN